MKIKEFKKQCEQIQDVCQPDKTWLKESRSFLMSQVGQTSETQEQKVPVWLKLADAFVPANLRLQPVAVYSLVLGLFLITSFASVNASKNTLPGHPLYPVKIIAENIKYNLSFSNQAKAKVAMSIVEKRVGELKIIAVEKQNQDQDINNINEKQKKVASAVSKVKSSLDIVKNKLNDIKEDENDENKKAVVVVKEIDEKLALVKNEIQETNKEIENEISEELEKTSIVVLAVLNEVEENEEGVVAGDKEEIVVKGVITSQATSTSSTSEQDLINATSSDFVKFDNIIKPENILVIEKIEKESEEFGVGIEE